MGTEFALFCDVMRADMHSLMTVYDWRLVTQPLLKETKTIVISWLLSDSADLRVYD